MAHDSCCICHVKHTCSSKCDFGKYGIISPPWLMIHAVFAMLSTLAPVSVILGNMASFPTMAHDSCCICHVKHTCSSKCDFGKYGIIPQSWPMLHAVFAMLSTLAPVSVILGNMASFPTMAHDSCCICHVKHTCSSKCDFGKYGIIPQSWPMLHAVFAMLSTLAPVSVILGNMASFPTMAHDSCCICHVKHTCSSKCDFGKYGIISHHGS